MEFNHLLKAGFGRRGFLSGSSLLLTGALLGATEEAKAKPAPVPAPAGSRAAGKAGQGRAARGPGHRESHPAGSGSGGWLRTRERAQSCQPESLFHFALAGARSGHRERHRGARLRLRSGQRRHTQTLQRALDSRRNLPGEAGRQVHRAHARAHRRADGNHQRTAPADLPHGRIHRHGLAHF